MATQAGYELSRPETGSGYTPAPGTLVVTQQPRATTAITIATWWDLLQAAAQRIYGGSIQLQQTVHAKNNLDRLVADLQFIVVHSEPQPRETKQTIVDISSKEYINRSERERDETFVKMSKTPLATGRRYHFYTTNGVRWNTSANLGAQILSMAMSGGTMRVGTSQDNWQVQGQDNAINPELGFQYFQEEKIVVPPGVNVTAKFITSTVKIEQVYTLQFFISSSQFVPISYIDPGCFGCCTASGFVNAAELLRTLPNYRLQGGLVYFTQTGTLTWIGEKCTIEKIEKTL